MKITKSQLKQIIKEELQRVVQEAPQRGDPPPPGAPTIQGVHPLLDGLASGNGTSAGVLKRVPGAIEIMEANPQVEEFKLALSIYNDRKPFPYYPFGFEKKLAQALEAAGASPEDVTKVADFGRRRDDEYLVPYSPEWYG